MKYLIASDIHGSGYYAKKLLSAFESEKADKLLLLGDLLYHGARNDLPKDYGTKNVFALLNEYKDKILAVRGNCDSEVDQMVLEFPIMADYLLLEADGITVFATHGHLYNKGHLPPLSGIDVLLHGHTHIPALEEMNGGYYMNPGSVSIPLGGSVNGYMTLEDGIFTWKDITGKTLKTMDMNKKKGRTAK